MKIFWLPFCCMFVLKQVHMLLYLVFGYTIFDEDDEDGNGKIFLYDIFISNYFVCLPAVRIYLIFSYDFKPCNNVTTLPIIIFMWYLQICLGYLSCWDIIVGHTQKSAISHSHMLSYTKKKKGNMLLTCFNVESWVLLHVKFFA